MYDYALGNMAIFGSIMGCLLDVLSTSSLPKWESTSAPTGRRAATLLLTRYTIALGPITSIPTNDPQTFRILFGDQLHIRSRF